MNGRVVIVTGAATGIGRAIAKRLAEKGRGRARHGYRGGGHQRTRR